MRWKSRRFTLKKNTRSCPSWACSGVLMGCIGDEKIAWLQQSEISMKIRETTQKKLTTSRNNILDEIGVFGNTIWARIFQNLYFQLEFLDSRLK